MYRSHVLWSFHSGLGEPNDADSMNNLYKILVDHNIYSLESRVGCVEWSCDSQFIDSFDCHNKCT